MKVVIIGNGKAGSSLSSMLANEGHDVTVIDINAAALEKTQNTEDVMCIEGNGIDADVQRDAAVNKAGMVIAATHHLQVEKSVVL